MKINFGEKISQKINQLGTIVEKNSSKFLVFVMVVIFVVLPIVTSRSQKVLGVSENVETPNLVNAVQEKPEIKKDQPKPESYTKAVRNQPSDSEIWSKFDLKVDSPVKSTKIRAVDSQIITGKLVLAKDTSCGFVSDKFSKNAQVAVSYEKKREFLTVCEIRILPPDVVGIINQNLFEKLADPTKTQTIQVSITY